MCNVQYITPDLLVDALAERRREDAGRRVLALVLTRTDGGLLQI